MLIYKGKLTVTVSLVVGLVYIYRSEWVSLASEWVRSSSLFSLGAARTRDMPETEGGGRLPKGEIA